MPADFVCGMEVFNVTSAPKSEYMGKTYYFCGPGCKKAFDKNPSLYIRGGGTKTSGRKV